MSFRPDLPPDERCLISNVPLINEINVGTTILNHPPVPIFIGCFSTCNDSQSVVNMALLPRLQLRQRLDMSLPLAMASKARVRFKSAQVAEKSMPQEAIVPAGLG